MEELDNIDLSDYTSEKLCEIIVCDRYLNVNEKFSIRCMEELTKRRVNGDAFDFENFIENAYKSLPEINISLSNFTNIIEKITG